MLIRGCDDDDFFSSAADARFAGEPQATVFWRRPSWPPERPDAQENVAERRQAETSSAIGDQGLQGSEGRSDRQEGYTQPRCTLHPCAGVTTPL